MKRIIIIMLLLLPIVTSTDWTNVTCSGGNLYKIKEWEICEDGTCTEYNMTENVTCTNGCDSTSNTCNPKEYEEWILYIGIILVVVIILRILGWL